MKEFTFLKSPSASSIAFLDSAIQAKWIFNENEISSYSNLNILPIKTSRRKHNRFFFFFSKFKNFISLKNIFVKNNFFKGKKVDYEQFP